MPGPLGWLSRWIGGAVTAAAPAALPVDPQAREAGQSARDADPQRQYVAGGWRPDLTLATLAQILSRLGDDIDRRFGDDVKDRMLDDPAVGAGVNYLCYSLVEHPAEVVPAFQVEPGSEDEGNPEAEARARTAAEAADFCRRLLNGLEEPIEDVILQMGPFVAYGCALAEKVFHVPEVGPDAGRLMLQAIRPKDRRAWQFVVDPFMTVVGILATTVDGSGEVILPAAKFCWLSWWPKGGDPRGRSIIRAAFLPWFGKVRLWPELLKHLARFASPFLVGKSSADAVPLPKRDSEGNLVAGQEESPEESLGKVLERARNGEWLAVAAGTEVEVHNPTGGGNTFALGYDLYDRQILLSILNSTRAILEARFGSRADSGTAKDITDIIVALMRRLVERMIAWQVFYPSLAMNFGEAYAVENCPDASLGQGNQPDILAELAGWVPAGYTIAPEHLRRLDARFGLKPRTEVEPTEPEPQPGQDQQEDEEPAEAA